MDRCLMRRSACGQVRSMVRHPADWGACLKDLGKFAGDMRRWTEERKEQLQAER